MSNAQAGPPDGGQKSSAGVRGVKVLMVAPFCPPERRGITHLGGSAKMRLVLQGLSESTGVQPVLLNSGHQDAAFSLPKWGALPLKNGVVQEFHPFTLPVRPVGRLLQAVFAPIWVLIALSRMKPDVVWLYNSLLFETIAAWTLRIVSPKSKIILEFEDLPTSREREKFGGLKTWLDSASTESVQSRVDLVTIVNMEMAPRLKVRREPYYLPVLLSGAGGAVGARTSGDESPARLTGGYFGGLEEGKGCLELLEVIENAPGDVRWLISGAGPLEPRFAELARKFPERVTFFGRLEPGRFSEVFAMADFVTNLHRPLETFGDGVFPFKLLEAISNGKIVISTRMKGCPPEVGGAIEWIDGEVVSGCMKAIRELSDKRASKMLAVEEASLWLRARFSYDIVVGKIVEAALCETGARN